MKPQALIFDLDGTLVDSLSDLARCTNEVLAENNFPIHPKEAYRLFVGNGVEKLIQRALPSAQQENAELLATMVERMRTLYSKSWDQQSAPYPDIDALLAQLVIANVPLAVLSNKPHNFTVQFIERFFPSVPFTVVRGAMEDCPLKPHPQAALEIAERLCLAPETIGFVGDSAPDILTAKNADMIAIGVTWGFRDQAELEEHGADYETKLRSKDCVNVEDVLKLNRITSGNKQLLI